MTNRNPRISPATAQPGTSTPNAGVIAAVHGSVVDVRFEDNLPPIYSMLHIDAAQPIVVEVLALRDAHQVCGIALTP